MCVYIHIHAYIYIHIYIHVYEFNLTLQNKHRQDHISLKQNFSPPLPLSPPNCFSLQSITHQNDMCVG